MAHDDLRAQLLHLERRLVVEGGNAYRELLAPEAVVVVPGARLDREQCADAIDAGPRWDHFDVSDVRLATSGETAAITYIFEGRRGDDHYRACLCSVYVPRDGGLRLLVHQQTPMP